ncbi:MAG: NAD-dependent epimerase/dehydratase family protein [Rikenellaceae bacterium]|nr:NAD-dependent epimerase/dehydratase family protein [Rikenellaceae bacterium]
MGNNKINTVAVSGADGFVGSHLTAYLWAQGVEVLPLGRRHFTDAGKGELLSAVGQADAVVNLAGAPINRRWTEKYKKELYASRIDTTRRLVDAIAASGGRVRVLCSASAVGYYSSLPSAGCNTEASPGGEGYLADLCRAWEDEA